MIRPLQFIIVAFMLNLLLVTGAVSVGAQITSRQIVYEGRIHDNLEILLLDIDRGVTYNLTQHPGEDRRPVWSPDGSKIAFESWRAGIRAVYVMDAAGGRTRRMSADSGASEYNPRWLPDGETLTFRSYYRAPGGETLVAYYQVNADGSNLRRLEFEDSTIWAPASQVISQRFVDGEWGIYVSEGDETRRLAGSEITYRETPRWSPDETLIAFLSPGVTEEQLEIFVMDANGEAVRQVTADGLPKSNLNWRPS